MSTLRRHLAGHRGYTYVEIIAVLAILSVLATVSLPHLAQATDNATVLKIRGDLQAIDSAIAIYGQPAKNTVRLTPAELTRQGFFTDEPTPPAAVFGYTLSEYAIDEKRQRAYLPVTDGSRTIRFYSDTPLSRLRPPGSSTAPQKQD